VLDASKGTSPLGGLCVYDGIVVVQIIERLLRSGGVSGRELNHVAALRTKVAMSIKQACGVSVDDKEPQPEATTDD